ncbi:toxin-antitoxin system HicB family antitoxin [Paenibacillus sp. M1]|uniref:Toxin-antitoxin system HicB family antitoxin n=1 Tax=Paenibacillus haidiansis TaxID=1574488 RepID=A0ABU7VS74_9BACL
MAGKKSFPLRLDPLIYEALERWAADEFRSVNGHIEYLLREALRREGRLPGPRGAVRKEEKSDADD